MRDSGVAIVLSVPINQNIGAYLLRFDKDGNMTNFSTDVTDIERNIKLTAFPNPTSDFITFDLEGFDNKPLEIQFYNIEGKLVFENTFYSFKQFDVSGLQNGIYSYRITSKSSLIKSGLFIKQ
ncbi:MAG: T9SS type A sorting domain-containing protein [Saprospiraceae bacterium]|nr:T9SS type A sorting domain-containing protein [Saprospiraceae bacterium]